MEAIPSNGFVGVSLINGTCIACPNNTMKPVIDKASGSLIKKKDMTTKAKTLMYNKILADKNCITIDYLMERFMGANEERKLTIPLKKKKIDQKQRVKKSTGMENACRVQTFHVILNLYKFIRFYHTIEKQFLRINLLT